MVSKTVLALGLVGAAFAVATITLAVFKVNDDALIKELEQKLENQTTTEAPTTSSPTPSPTETPTTDPDVPEEITYRLPSDVIPTLYTLHLNPNLIDKYYNGTNDITVDVRQRTNSIVVHSNGLTIKSVEFRTGNRYIVSTFSLDTKREFLRVQLAEFVEPGADNVLSIAFSGSLENKIVGFYGSSYVNPQGQQR